MGNSRTRSVSRKYDQFHYLELMPARLREAFRNSSYEWDTKWFYDKWNDGKSVDWCIAELRKTNIDEAKREHKWRKGFKWETQKSSYAEVKVKPLGV